MQKLNHIHFIGIGGSGMSVLADYALKLGIKVTGSDQNSSAVISKLKEDGADIKIGHYLEAITNENILVVFSTAIPDTDKELIHAKNSGCEVIHRSDLLYKFMDGKKNITVAGTHGKTTTSALLYYTLERIGASPHGIIGGRLADSAEGGFTGESELFVAEVDESDGSFLNSVPHIAVLTNVEADHLDFYGNESRMNEAYSKYLPLRRKKVLISLAGILIRQEKLLNPFSMIV